MACPDQYELSDIALGRQYAAQGLGMFIHFGIETYYGAWNWSPEPGSDPKTFCPASTFAPPATLNVDEWIAVAKMMGATYAVLTVKHTFGFCLWPSSYTTYTIENADAAINSRDLVDEFVTSCAKYGLNPCFYYCCANREQSPDEETPGDSTTTGYMNDAAQITYMKNQLTELMAYGPHAFWLDSAAYINTTSNPHANGIDIYNHIKATLPNCTVLTNHGSSFISVSGCERSGLHDIVDGRSDVALAERTLLPSPDYQLPLETCWTSPYSGGWFCTDDNETPDETAAEIVGYINGNLDYGAAFLLNMGPGPNGRITNGNAALAREIAILRGKISEKSGVLNHALAV